jgi:FAD-dependent oxidoreductase domain-containing protein 1
MAGPTVVIIGGGIVGSMTAYFLRQEGHVGRIVVLERDPSYRFSSTALSAAAIRTQFGCAVNVRMSLFGVAFIRALEQRFGAGASIGFRENGYLFLGSPGTEAARLAGVAMQRGEGAEIDVIEPADLAVRFPWLNPDGIAVATCGWRNEGWFDAWALLDLARNAARALGVEYVHDAATGINTQGDRVTAVRTASGAVLPADWVVNAAGALSGRVAAWLGIDLPVTPRKRTVFFIKGPLDGSDMPLLFDTSGLWMRPEGDGFICGIAPPGFDPDADGDFEPDHALFEEIVWPALAHRVPALEQLRVERSWAGHYEVCALDHNGIVGPHDTLENFIFATGFSGHGVMHAPATGRGVAELIVHGAYRSLDLSELGYSRIRQKRPMVETVVY